MIGARWPPLGRARQLAQLRDAARGAAEDQHVVGHHRVVAVGVDHPVLAATDRDDPHADFDGELDGRERAVRQRGVGPHPHTVRHLFGGREVGDQRSRDAEAVGDDAGDVDGSIAHALDGRQHVQHARHLFGVARRTGREHAHLAHRVREILESLLEVVDLVGHALVAEEQRGVREIDHELGGVFRLRQHVLEISGGFVVWCHLVPARAATQG